MSAFEERIQQLRKRYSARAAIDRKALIMALDREDWAEVRRIAHGLAGTGAVFGFPDVSVIAQQLEEGVDEDLAPTELRRLGEALEARLDKAAQER